MATELQAVVAVLGGEKILGRSLKTDGDLRSAIREGFPQGVLGAVMDSAGISLNPLAAMLDLSARSLQRRRKEGRLTLYESDRLYRLARILAIATRQLGGDAIAKRWLRRSNRAFGGQAPLELIDTEPGARAVENVLGRIAYGGIS